MYAVGRLISKGVYTVAGPFHPFGGAVDIIVVQQQDGSFKSSPWYVKFGKFQGMLKRAEKVVNIAVNDDEKLDFHMYLDSTGEAYFLKDAEPDKEPSSPPLAITSGEEVKLLEDSPSKLEDGLESKVAVDDVEKGESSDEQDSNLALRFEGRKASFLLVQQAAEARAAEEARNEGAEYKVELAESSTFEESGKIKEDSEALEEAELPERVIFIKDTEVIEDAELPGSVLLVKDTEAIADTERPEKVLLVKDTDVIEGAEGPENVLVKGTEVIEEAEGSTSKEDKDVAGDAPDGLLASLAALRARNISAENENGASVIHTLLNRSVGLEETLQTGRPSTSLVAEAALAAVAKAAWEPGSVDSPKDLGKEYRDSFEVLNNNGEVIARGLRLRRSASLNLGSEPVADEAISRRRVKSESDLGDGMKGIESESFLGLVESDLRGLRSEPDLRSSANGDNSSELSTLTITTADGVVVLQTPRGGSPPPSTIQEDHVHQQPIVYEGDGQEKPLVLGMLEFEQVVGDETKLSDNPVEGPNPSPEKKETGTLLTAGSGGWWWPYLLRPRPKTPEMNGSSPRISQEEFMAATKAGVDSAMVNNIINSSAYYIRLRKNARVRSYVPTSQMLASMKLKEGKNRITFTFVTQVLGTQQVDARIYLWKWNTRVVISDVDGTITKSDVLGQVMPLVGRDWTQSGVTRLFSAIKENGYEVMFLSARAISQAYLTRQFLLNLKQDGEALPDGPVVISPDGLFPSLYREVIRRAPQEFKIACLQDIRDLFPEDCNPFYAGFGNRDTDEISYLKVGIPKGKIFIINPKGEVAVNHRVDVKSYTSLHKLVDDMFPPQASNEQEEFNDLNYWKLPVPDIEDELSVKSTSKQKKTKK